MIVRLHSHASSRPRARTFRPSLEWLEARNAPAVLSPTPVGANTDPTVVSTLLPARAVDVSFLDVNELQAVHAREAALIANNAASRTVLNAQIQLDAAVALQVAQNAAVQTRQANDLRLVGGSDDTYQIGWLPGFNHRPLRTGTEEPSGNEEQESPAPSAGEPEHTTFAAVEPHPDQSSTPEAVTTRGSDAEPDGDLFWTARG